MTPVTIERTPTFSRSSVCEGVSKITLAGWKAIGLCLCVSQRTRNYLCRKDHTYPIMRSNCC